MSLNQWEYDVAYAVANFTVLEVVSFVWVGIIYAGEKHLERNARLQLHMERAFDMALRLYTRKRLPNYV